MGIKKQPITKGQIIAWAKAHRASTGGWPLTTSPAIAGAGMTWSNVRTALKDGTRGLPGGERLGSLLYRLGGERWKLYKDPLTVKQILDWADQYYERVGQYPGRNAGTIPKSGGLTWQTVDGALASNRRGLKVGLTLRQLLMKVRDARSRTIWRPQLTPQMILKWADAHKRRTGKWPLVTSGVVKDAADETWLGVGVALKGGGRGLPGGSSLSRLLAEHRSRRDQGNLSRLTMSGILKWADALRRRTGQWPRPHSGSIPGTNGETWRTVDSALFYGRRGMPKTSLAAILHEHRGVRRLSHLPILTESQILAFVRAQLARTGRWPSFQGGPISGSQETWTSVGHALSHGTRGLPKYLSLSHFLQEHFGRDSGTLRAGKREIKLPYRSGRHADDLSHERIVCWAVAFNKRTARWPTCNSGPIPEAPGETWCTVSNALSAGKRSLPSGGPTLSRLLSRQTGRRHQRDLPPLTAAMILKWADEHFKRAGRWPRDSDGAIPGSGGETWGGISRAASHGSRNLPGKWTLHQLLARERGKPSGNHPLTLGRIRGLIKKHLERTGRLPHAGSGALHGSVGDSWAAINNALRLGLRGLSPNNSLSNLTRPLSDADASQTRPRLRLDEILLWARAHHRRQGTWPERYSGRIPDAPGETWLKVDEALRKSQRGIHQRTNLIELLRKQPAPRRFD